MTRRTAFLSLEQADARLGELSPWLSAVAQPRKQVREVLAIAAFYRGEIDRLRALTNEQQTSHVARLEKKRN